MIINKLAAGHLFGWQLYFFMKLNKKPFYIICDNIRSLENIGSIFRTADALTVDKIFLCGICGRPPQAKISKTALGAEDNVAWEHHWQTWRVIDKLKKQGVNIIALEQTKNSLDYRKFKPKFSLALVVGNEVKGICQSVLRKADQVIHLPMLGSKESLNVSVAFGVIGYYLRK